MADEKDDVSVEGSAARIADRGRDQLGFGEGSTLPSLGSPDVVSELVGDFCQTVLDIRGQYSRDEIRPDQAKAEIRYLARQYGRIIMGKDRRFDALGWHSPERLGVKIKKVVPVVPGVTDPGEALFVTLAGSLVSLNVAVEGERITDENAKRELLSLMEQANDLILGR